MSANLLVKKKQNYCLFEVTETPATRLFARFLPPLVKYKTIYTFVMSGEVQK